MTKKRDLFSDLVVVFLCVLGIAGLLGIVKTIFIGIDIDESYAISQAYRLLKGDKLISDMWEPHQFSAYPTALFLKLYVMITGSTDYAVIYLRLCGTLIHLLLAFFLYRVIRLWTTSGISLLVILMHINFLAKWIQTPEFEIMQYWLMLCTALCLITYFRKGRGTLLLVFSGIAMLLQLFNYPTMILLYFFYMFGLYKIDSPAVVRRRAVLITTLSAFLSGLCVIGYLLSYQTVDELLINLGYVLADPSHTGESFFLRMRGFFIEFVWDILLFAVVSAVALPLVYLYYRLSHKTSSTLPRRKWLIQTGLLAFVLLCFAQMIGCLFLDQNQFFLQERYLYITILGIVVYRIQGDKQLIPQLLYRFGLIPAVVSVFATALLTNMTLNVSYSKLFLGCIFTFLLMITCYDREEQKQLYLPISFLVMSLLVCKLVLMRVTGCLPVTIHARLQKIQNGPLGGVYLLEEYARAYEADQDLLGQYVSSTDNLFIFGRESLLYVGCDAQVSVASVLSTSVFNQVFLDYLNLHPEKYPTVIAVDKRFALVPEYCYYLENHVVEEWIETEYRYSQKVESDYMTLYIR